MDLAELKDYLELLELKIDAIHKAVQAQKKKDILFGEWVSEKEIIEMTGLSRNTLYNLRLQGKITRSSIGKKKNYYRISDFKKLLEKNEKEN
jgi:hypothetical protein